jgi:hypothetical protein
MCNKIKYDRIGAMFALSQTKHRGNYNPRRNEQRIYYCKICNAWHLTSKSQKHASSKERIKDYIQIFGHTMLSRPYFEDKIICLDCKKAFILENNEIKEF